MIMIERRETSLPEWLAALILVGFALIGAPTNGQAQTDKPQAGHKVVKYGFPFYNGYEAGLAAGRASGKPILLDFYFDT